MIGLVHVDSSMRMLAALLSVALFLGFATPGVATANDIANFSQVNDELYRGGQPDLKAMQQLKLLGVKSVINLRMTNDVWKGEQATILAAISSMPKPVFVHCQYGCDRTGTVIACYRIQRDHWANSKALKEAEAHGISRNEVEMRNYIERFKK